MSETGGDDADAQQAMQPTAAAFSTPPEHAGCQNMTTFPKAVHDVFGWDDLLSPAEVQLRYKVRAFMVGLLASVHLAHDSNTHIP